MLQQNLKNRLFKQAYYTISCTSECGSPSMWHWTSIQRIVKGMCSF